MEYQMPAWVQTVCENILSVTQFKGWGFLEGRHYFDGRDYECDVLKLAPALKKLSDARL